MLNGIRRAINGVSNGPGVFIDLIIISSDKGLVAEEVDGLVFDARDTLLGFDVLQAVCLVPAGGEDVEGDLTTNGVTRTQVSIIPWSFNS